MPADKTIQVKVKVESDDNYVDFTYDPTTCHIFRNKQVTFECVGGPPGATFDIEFKTTRPFKDKPSSTLPRHSVIGDPESHHHYWAVLTLQSGKKYEDPANCPTLIVK